MTRSIASLAVAAFLVAPGALFADTLDFSGYGPGLAGTTSIALANAVVTGEADATDLDISATAGPNSVCGWVAGSCEGDLQIDFTAPVANLKFIWGIVSAGDSVDLSVYGPDDSTLLTTLTLDNSGNNGFGFGDTDLTAFGAIGRIYFADKSSAGGLSYGDWMFDKAAAAAVPLPASLPLLLAGLGAFGALRRRRRR